VRGGADATSSREGSSSRDADTFVSLLAGRRAVAALTDSHSYIIGPNSVSFINFVWYRFADSSLLLGSLVLRAPAYSLRSHACPSRKVLLGEGADTPPSFTDKYSSSNAPPRSTRY